MLSCILPIPSLTLYMPGPARIPALLWLICVTWQAAVCNTVRPQKETDCSLCEACTGTCCADEPALLASLGDTLSGQSTRVLAPTWRVPAHRALLVLHGHEQLVLCIPHSVAKARSWRCGAACHCTATCQPSSSQPCCLQSPQGCAAKSPHACEPTSVALPGSDLAIRVMSCWGAFCAHPKWTLSGMCQGQGRRCCWPSLHACWTQSSALVSWPWWTVPACQAHPARHSMVQRWREGVPADMPACSTARTGAL